MRDFRIAYAELFLLVAMPAVVRAVICNNGSFGCNDTALDNERKLTEFLLDPSRYNPNVRPKRNHLEALVINVTWQISKLTRVDEKEGIIAHTATAKFVWLDEYLQWNPADYGGLSAIYVLGKYIWTPKLVTSNKYDESFLDNINNDIFQIKSDGEVSFLPYGDLSIICDMNPEQFPYDCHTCSFSISFGYFTMNYIHFSASHERLGAPSSNDTLVWQVENLSMTVPEWLKNVINISIKFKRKPLFYISVILVPSIILSVITMAIYFIPEEEGEKISCGITVFLAFIVFLLQISDSLPENSNSLPGIGVFFMMLMISSVVVIIDSVIMVNRPKNIKLECKDEKEQPGVPESISFVTVKQAKCAVNKWSLAHNTCGVICFVLIGAAYITFFVKRFHGSCEATLVEGK